MHKKKTAKTNKKTSPQDEASNAFLTGLSNMRLKGFIELIIACLIAMLVVKNRDAIVDATGISEIFVYCIWLLPVFVIMMQGDGKDKTEQDIFESIGLSNSLGETPELLHKEKDKDNPKVEIRTYQSESIPVTAWQAKRTELESAFDCSIAFIEKSNTTKQEILVGMVSGKHSIPTSIVWDNSLTPGINLGEKKHQEEETGKVRGLLKKLNTVDEQKKVDGSDGFQVILGEGITGPVLADLDSQPHMIIAGTTGSGKSVALRSIVWQCILKGAKVFICDFKGGIEFSKAWESFTTIYSEREDALAMLQKLAKEMKARNELLSRSGCKNIISYNKKHPEAPLARIILACDEMAEMVDSEGVVDKEEKDMIKEINKELSSFARLSRSAGINMILATQRPDAKVVNGQIRANTPLRMCGRVSKAVESEIVLGDMIADTISERQRGRFYCNVNGLTELQSYWFVDDDHMVGTGEDYQIGTTLLMDDEKPSVQKEYQDDVEQLEAKRAVRNITKTISKNVDKETARQKKIDELLDMDLS